MTFFIVLIIAGSQSHQKIYIKLENKPVHEIAIFYINSVKNKISDNHMGFNYCA